MATRIALDRYIYQDIYPAYQAATDERALTAKIDSGFLKRLYFVVQRAPKEFAADHSVTGLTRFVHEIRRVIESQEHCLPSTERMQIFCRGDASQRLREVIGRAIAADNVADI